MRCRLTLSMSALFLGKQADLIGHSQVLHPIRPFGDVPDVLFEKEVEP